MGTNINLVIQLEVVGSVWTNYPAGLSNKNEDFLPVWCWRVQWCKTQRIQLRWRSLCVFGEYEEIHQLVQWWSLPQCRTGEIAESCQNCYVCHNKKILGLFLMFRTKFREQKCCVVFLFFLPGCRFPASAAWRKTVWPTEERWAAGWRLQDKPKMPDQVLTKDKYYRHGGIYLQWDTKKKNV